MALPVKAATADVEKMPSTQVGVCVMQTSLHSLTGSLPACRGHAKVTPTAPAPPQAFLGAFGLKRGAVLGDYRVRAVSSGHDALARYRHYAFPLTCELECEDGDGSSSAALAAFRDAAHEPRVVYSQYGNPYGA